MRFILRGLAVILPLSLAAAGCGVGDPTVTGPQPYIVGDLATLTYRAVDKMVVSAPEIARDTPLVVTSLSDVQDLDRSSALGNIVADMIRTRLVQNGYTTSEIRLRNAIGLQIDDGEFVLSRSSKVILPPQHFAAILTGTYTAASEKVYISLKFISVGGRIIAGVDYVVPRREVSPLLLPRSL
ncbi:MAG: FlgO family outer membrane protein [Rhodopila sp.]|jgi:hypothetical protein